MSGLMNTSHCLIMIFFLRRSDFFALQFKCDCHQTPVFKVRSCFIANSFTYTAHTENQNFVIL